ncbi:hypothetical protein CR51_41505 [Caballeronia megalochromosomata]|jgi:hypothetical protein|nr:hypothetical protein CR51_41505 [Caballeronia megalochromosomata]
MAHEARAMARAPHPWQEGHGCGVRLDLRVRRGSNREWNICSYYIGVIDCLFRTSHHESLFDAQTQIIGSPMVSEKSAVDSEPNDQSESRTGRVPIKANFGIQLELTSQATEDFSTSFGDKLHDARESGGGPKQRFWRELMVLSGGNAKPDDLEQDIERYERKLFDEFPHRLASVIRRETQDHGQGKAFTFTVSRRSYGSLYCMLDLAGVQNFIDVFDKNFDLFVALTEPFVASAFSETFNISRQYFSTKLVDLSGMQSAFDAAQVTPRPLGEPSTAPDATRLAHLKYVWQVVQGTLVLPVLLALAVCLIAMNAWMHERDNQKGEREDLTRERNALLDFAKSNINSLTQQNSELSRAIAQNAASEVVAMTQSNVALAKSVARSNCCADSSDTATSKTKTAP